MALYLNPCRSVSLNTIHSRTIRYSLFGVYFHVRIKMLYLCSSTISVQIQTMKPALFLFLLVVQGIMIPGIESFSVPTHVVRGRGVQAFNLTVGLHGECNGKEPGGKIVALLRKGGGSRGGSGSGGRGGSGKGAPGSGGSDISHRPRSKVSSVPSTSSDPLFLLILGLACGTLPGLR